MSGNNIYTVCVIGISGAHTDGKEYKVGKSVFCNRFINSAFEDLVLTHDSIYDEKNIKESVINNSYLYWGTSTMPTKDCIEVKFSLLELTHLRSDPLSFFNESEYLERVLKFKPNPLNKLRYYSPEQVRNVENFPKIYMDYESNESSGNGYVIIYNIDPNMPNASDQDQLFVKICKVFSRYNIPAVVAITKCDMLPESTDFTKQLLSNVHKIQSDLVLDMPIIETSAVKNVNITTTIQALHARSIGENAYSQVKNYRDAYRSVSKRNKIFAHGVRNMIMLSQQKISTMNFENFQKEYENDSRIKNVIYSSGKIGLRAVFEECRCDKIAKLKEKMVQKCLCRYQDCVPSVLGNYNDGFKKHINTDDLIHIAKQQNVYNKWFQDLDIFSDVLNIEHFIESIEQQTNNQDIKIPVDIIRLPPFELILDKHIAKYYVASKSELLKDRLEIVLNKLTRQNEISIITSKKEAIHLMEMHGEPELAEHLSLPDVTLSFENYIQKLHMKARYNLHELIFEQSHHLKHIKYINRNQIVTEISNKIKTDIRYCLFDETFAKLRDNIIFTHYTFCNSNCYCLQSPLVQCCDNVVKDVVFNLDSQKETKQDVENDKFMILFVLGERALYSDFKKEFMNYALKAANSYYTMNINGTTRKIILISVDSVNVDWDTIITEYTDETMSFVCLYGDMESLKLMESILLKLQNLYVRSQSCSNISLSYNNLANNTQKAVCTNFTYSFDNFVIIFCLKAHILDNYRSYFTQSNNYTFFQETPLGRLTVLGRNLSAKYSSKYIDVVLENIMEKSAMPVVHESQVMNSLKYLEEIIFPRPNFVKRRHTRSTNIRILACCMCGDNFPLEIVIGMLLQTRQYEYSNKTETIHFEYKTGGCNYLVNLKLHSYHTSSMLSNKEYFHSCILIYNTGREASYRVFRAFLDKTEIKLLHVIGVSGRSSNSWISVQKTFQKTKLVGSSREEMEAMYTNRFESINVQVATFNNFLSLSSVELQHQNKERKNSEQSMKISPQPTFECDTKYGTLQLGSKNSNLNVLKAVSEYSNIKPPTHNGGKNSKESRVDWSQNAAFRKNHPNIELDLDEEIKPELMERRKKEKKFLKDLVFKSSAIKKIGAFRSIADLTSALFDNTIEKDKNSSEQSKEVLNSKQEEKRRKEMKNKSKLNTFHISKLHASKKTTNKDKDHLNKMTEWNARFSNNSQNAKYKYFGKPIDQIPLVNNIPTFVIKCVQYVEASGMLSQGIYRRNGSKQDIESFKIAFEADNFVDLSKLQYNIYVITGGLKSFFATLPGCLITNKYNNDILKATNISDPISRVESIKTMTATFPQTVRNTLSYLSHHFYKVTLLEEHNKMTANNLAICFWPTLINISSSPEFGNAVQSGDTVMFSLFLHVIIENAQYIFGDCPLVTTQDVFNLTPTQNTSGTDGNV